ncbi:MAG: thioredoxin family protein [Myxococcota bacterium]
MLHPRDLKDFEKQVLDSIKPVIVCFAADWSTPSMKANGMLERLDEASGEDVVIARVDVSKIPEAAAHYDLFMLPTTILFVEGIALEIAHGLQSFDKLEELLTQAREEHQG